MEKYDLDALKLLADWSKWLASIQTGVISLLGVFSASGKASIVGKDGAIWLAIAIMAFLLSLLSASLLLYSLPRVAQRLPPPSGKDVLMMGTFNGGGIKVVVFSAAEFVGFGVGVICLSIWAIVQVLH